MGYVRNINTINCILFQSAFYKSKISKIFNIFQNKFAFYFDVLNALPTFELLHFFGTKEKFFIVVQMNKF